ncbi:nuclear transport factor 2 family protein [Kineosporia babensis]|uniref:Nuclear transport factor 2 family protein n=1 Tax=Kineosporia babensis TaxID=499548 RepID=A0A9X1NIS8_9ACTN|nr:nuclear transport factor 2 family protein [Kineosporia babensis]MCD5315817.1 nuclear transport factor 2 family protein [Kineosporia babensis]
MTSPAQSEIPAPARAYFEAWRTNRPQDLVGVFAPDIRVNGPLGQIDGDEQYQQSIARIFSVTKDITIRRQWIDGNDVMTWFDLHPHGEHESWPVANWVTVENGQITRVHVTFDLTKLLAAGGDPRRASDQN